MPICVFDSGPRERLHDSELDTLLFKMPPEWIIREHRITKRLFRKKTTFLYSLLKRLSDADDECQLINFYVAGSNTSMNTRVPAGYITAYLYGVMAEKESHRKRLRINPISVEDAYGIDALTEVDEAKNALRSLLFNVEAERKIKAPDAEEWLRSIRDAKKVLGMPVGEV